MLPTSMEYVNSNDLHSDTWSINGTIFAQDLESCFSIPGSYINHAYLWEGVLHLEQM